MPRFGPTTDHVEIQTWAKKHNAHPSEIRPYIFDSEPSVLCFIFGDLKVEMLEVKAISWDSFFAHFDLMGLSLVYDTEPNRKADSGYEFIQQEDKDPYRTHKLTN